MKKNALHISWLRALEKEFSKPYFTAIADTIKKDILVGKTIYPKGKDMFAVFRLTPIDEVKVVILGQDPYHGPGQAHGLAFSVQQGIDIPPSLKNIFIEIRTDLNLPSTAFSNGCLTSWAKQGIFLLNTSLSVVASTPMSHAHIGWHLFTDEVIRILNTSTDNIVFLLWGKSARSKSSLIDQSKHLILEAPHPSPLSAHRGFIGCKHFSQANTYLHNSRKKPIDWTV